MWLSLSRREIKNDGYLGLYTTPVPNTILRSSNFRSRNSSNFNAAIQIFLYLHEPNSRIFHSYDKSRLIIAPLRVHLITNLCFLPRNDIPQKAFYGLQVFWLIEIKNMWQWLSQVFWWQKSTFFLSVKVIYWSIPSPMFT